MVDSKSEIEELGSLLVTNLRIIWILNASEKRNLSLGLDCIASISSKMGETVLKGVTENISIQAKYKNSQFEFIFGVRHYDSTTSAKIIPLLDHVKKAYDESKLYRNIKIRGELFINSEYDIKLLEYEDIKERVCSVL